MPDPTDPAPTPADACGLAPPTFTIRTFGLDPDFHNNYSGSRAILNSYTDAILRRRNNTQLIKAAIATCFPIYLAAREKALDDLKAALLQQQRITLELAVRLGMKARVTINTVDPIGPPQDDDDTAFIRQAIQAQHAKYTARCERHGFPPPPAIEIIYDLFRLPPAPDNPTIARIPPSQKSTTWRQFDIAPAAATFPEPDDAE